MNDLVRQEDPVPRDVVADDAPGTGSEDDNELGALLAALSSHDLGAPTEEFDMTTLTPTERKALLRLLRSRLGIDPCEEKQCGKEEGMPGGTETP